MTDPIVLGAENDTLRQELNRANARIEELEFNAVPITERETGKDQDAAFLARLYLDVDKISSTLSDVAQHLKGRIDGLDAESAHSQAFEVRVTAALNSIESAIQMQTRTLETISANQALIIDEIRKHGWRIGELETKTRATIFDQLIPG